MFYANKMSIILYTVNYNITRGALYIQFYEYCSIPTCHDVFHREFQPHRHHLSQLRHRLELNPNLKFKKNISIAVHSLNNYKLEVITMFVYYKTNLEQKQRKAQIQEH